MSTAARDAAQVRVPLNHPIEVEGELLHELSLPRPRVKHLLAYDRATGEMGKMAALLGELTALPPSAVAQIDAADFLRVTGVLNDFLSPGPATGAPSAQSSRASSTSG